MKIKSKLILGFLLVSSLVVIVGIIGLNASSKIAAVYSGLNEEFQDEVEAAIEAQSYAKRAEGHLMLYLILNTTGDKEKFFNRHKSLEEQIKILERTVTTEGGKEQVEMLKSASSEILNIGKELIQAHDSSLEKFEPKDYSNLITSLNDAASKVREAGVQIAKRRTIDSAVEASSYAKRAEGHLMIYLTLGSEIDKQKFFERHASLKKEIEILEISAKSPNQLQLIEKLKSASDSILSIGNALIEAHDKNPESFNPKNHAQLFIALNDAASSARQAGVDIAKLEAAFTGENLKEARKTADLTRFTIIESMLIVVIIAVVVGLIFSHYISKPINELTKAAEEIAKGNLDIELKVKTKDELSKLADTFNNMAVQLKNLQHVKKIQKLEKELEALEATRKIGFISKDTYKKNKERVETELRKSRKSL